MKTYCVTSGKGGVGKTTLSANLGIALAKMGRRVVVFDADLSLANLDLVLGVRADHSLQHVLAGEKQLGEIVTPAPGGIGVICGGSAVGNLMASGPKRIGKFLEQLAHLESHTDILIFDTGAGLDTKVMSFAKAADDVLLIATPEPTSVTDAYATAKILWKRRPDARIHVVANQVSGPDEGYAIYSTLNSIAASFLQKSLEYAGAVPADETVTKCIRKRRPLLLEAPSCKAAEGISEVAAQIAKLQTSSFTSLSERLTLELESSEEAA